MTIAYPWDTPVDGQPWEGPETDEMTAYVQREAARRNLLASGAWRISAATDATGADLAGGNDATFLPTGGSDYGPVFVSPALDGPAVALRVDSNTFPDNGLRTPDSEAISVTGDLMLRYKGRGLPDLAATGEDRYAFVGKSLDTDDVNPDYPVYELSIDLATSRPTLIWHDSSEEQQVASIEEVVDPLVPFEMLCRLDVDNDDDGHTVGFYLRDDTATDFVLDHDSSGWRLLAEAVGEGVTSIYDSSGALRAAMFRAASSLGAVYDSIASAATPVAWMDPADAGGFLIDGTFVSALTGETWTVPSYGAAIVPVAAPGWVCGIPQVDESRSRLVVPNGAAIEFGTGDGTVALRVTTSVDGEAFAVYLAFFTGTFGQGGVGLLFVEADGSGGIGGGVESTGVAFAVTAHTAGDHVLSLSVDRAADELSVYLDGGLIGSAQDISTVGDLDDGADLVLGNAPLNIVRAAAKWDRVLTAEEHADLVAVLV